MSYADELKKRTKTKEQLDDERLKREKRKHQEAIKWTISYIKLSCDRAASRGEQTASDYLRAGDYDSVSGGFTVHFNTKEQAIEYAEEVKACLAADGLTDFRYKVGSIGFFSNKSYNVKYTAQW